MATMNGSARSAADVAGLFDSQLGDGEGGRAAPRRNPEVLARAKRRTYTGEYKQKVLAEADTFRFRSQGLVVARSNRSTFHFRAFRRLSTVNGRRNRCP